MDDDGEKRKGVFLVPHKARLYLLLGAFFLALPSLNEFYPGEEGKFLVSRGPLSGSFFDRTVIYVEDHDLFKAHGYVINKSAPDTLSKLGQRDYLGISDFYIGGPVNPDEVVGVLYAGDVSSGFRIWSGSDLAAAHPEFFTQLEEGALDYPVKGYFGYAGWSPWQLNIELLRGQWYVLDYDPGLMFDAKPNDMWKKAMEMLGKEPMLESYDSL